MTLVKEKPHAKATNKKTSDVLAKPTVRKSPRDPRNGSIRRFRAPSQPVRTNRTAVPQSRPKAKSIPQASRRVASQPDEQLGRGDNILLAIELFFGAWFFLTIGFIIGRWIA